ncbi:MAG: hypothetical protein ABFD90_16695, partial [Phycisphaerales bacterium]
MMMRDRFREVLVNPTWEQIVERDPLIAFSFCLSGRVGVLLSVADEIIEHLDAGFRGDCVDFDRVARAESLMWLWMLGAYEVVRTMCQARGCFSERVTAQLTELKRVLGGIRVPVAKMEKPGKKIPVPSDRSPAGWDSANRDLFVGDPTAPPDTSARFVLREFDRVLSSIAKDDVLRPHEESYARGQYQETIQ